MTGLETARGRIFIIESGLWLSPPNYRVGMRVAPASWACRTEEMYYVIFMVPVKFTE